MKDKRKVEGYICPYCGDEHLQVSPYCEKYTVKIDNPTKGAEKNE